MLKFPREYRIQPEQEDLIRLLSKAQEALINPIPHITDYVAAESTGSANDYYSNGDYWWPDPATKNGLPYIRRDGQSNPDNFNVHRLILRKMKEDVVWLTAAFERTGKSPFAEKAVRILKEFFLDSETHMNSNLNYAQAIPGVCEGRGIGIIDTLHLTDVVYAADKLSVLGALPDDVLSGLKKWFSEYSDWLLHSRNGQDERGNGNNHTICYYVQLAAFSLFTEDRETVEVCRDAYKNELLYQMEDNGSFPAELNRTKPYNYSVFTLDNMVSLCHMLSEPENNLWEFSLPGGRSIKKGLDFMMPYLLDKSAWPYPKDVMHFESYPARFSMMIFAGCTLGIRNLIDLYDRLPADITDEEVRRNSAVLYPLLWM